MAERLRIAEIIFWLLGVALLILNFVFPPWHHTLLITTRIIHTAAGPVGVSNSTPTGHRIHWREPLALGRRAHEIHGIGHHLNMSCVDWRCWFLWSLAIMAGTLGVVVPLRLWQRRLYGLRSGFEVLLSARRPT